MTHSEREQFRHLSECPDGYVRRADGWHNDSTGMFIPIAAHSGHWRYVDEVPDPITRPKDHLIAVLLDKVEVLKHQVTIHNQALHEKNLSLDALHYIWCTGPCKTGVHRWTAGELTPEIVDRAEALVKRMRIRVGPKPPTLWQSLVSMLVFVGYSLSKERVRG